MKLRRSRKPRPFPSPSVAKLRLDLSLLREAMQAGSQTSDIETINTAVAEYVRFCRRKVQ